MDKFYKNYCTYWTLFFRLKFSRYFFNLEILIIFGAWIFSNKTFAPLTTLSTSSLRKFWNFWLSAKRPETFPRKLRKLVFKKKSFEYPKVVLFRWCLLCLLWSSQKELSLVCSNHWVVRAEGEITKCTRTNSREKARTLYCKQKKLQQRCQYTERN